MQWHVSRCHRGPAGQLGGRSHRRYRLRLWYVEVQGVQISPRLARDTAGVGLGSVCFVILAKLVHAPVAQGFLLAVFIYCFAWMKALGLKYFAFSLLAILLAFSGIYSGYLVDGFSPPYLESYILAYVFGGAIVLLVNIVVFPTTSEKQVRTMLTQSLNHAAT